MGVPARFSSIPIHRGIECEQQTCRSTDVYLGEFQWRTRKPHPALIVAFLVWTIHAQVAGPAFDVASVKIDEHATRGSPLQRSCGRVSWVTGRLNFVSYAFRVPIERITGLNRDEAWWAVEAETAPSATDDQIRSMLQRLLVERFQLAVHRETKDHKVFALVVAKSGPKMNIVKPGEEVSPPPKGVLKGIKPTEGHVISYGRNSHSAMIGRRVTMQALAEALVGPVGTPVIDDTGLRGTLIWT